MYCRYCGAANDDRATNCAKCGAALGVVLPKGSAPANVPSYLVHAILTTVFCCLPFGIVAIVFAAQVSSKLAAGDVAGAVESSNRAKTWSLVAFLCGLVPALFYVFCMAAYIMTNDVNVPQ